MGLETASFISGLTASWPLASDKKNQGDDHLRLLKTVLQGTFPGASKAFYFPSAEAISGTQTLDATDMNNTQYVDTSGGNIAMTLPVLATADKGWQVEVVKIGTDNNAVLVAPNSGSILSKSGSTATIRVGVAYEPTRFFWNGTAWYCFKPGPMIGSTENFDGATTPPGYLDADGSSFSSTDFAELFAVLASSVLKDKRGRVEARVDGAAGRLTSGANGFATDAVLGASSGHESHTLALAQLPTGITSGGVNHISVGAEGSLTWMVAQSVQIFDFQDLSGEGVRAPGNTAEMANANSSARLGGDNAIVVTSNNTSGGAHKNVQPTIIVKKIIRAC